MSMNFSKMSTAELLALKAALSKKVSLGSDADKKNPEAFVDPGKTPVSTGGPSVNDTSSPEGSQYDKVTKPQDKDVGKMSTNKKDVSKQSKITSGDGTDVIPMGGKPVESKPSTDMGPKAEEGVIPPSPPQASPVPPASPAHPAAAPAPAPPVSAAPVRREEDEEGKLKEEEDEDEEECVKAAKVSSKYEALAGELSHKMEEEAKIRTKLEGMRAKLEEELGKVTSALGAAPATPPTAQPDGSDGSVGQEEDEEAKVPSFLKEDEEDDEARKALKFKGRMVFSAMKDIDSALSAATKKEEGPVVGSHPQPEAKIPAEPGKSGSSEVYHEEKGKPSLDLQSPSVSSEVSGGNPKKLVENAAGTNPEDISGKYPKDTEVVSGTGYTGKSKGSESLVKKISDLRPDWKELGRDRLMPTLKHMVSERIPTVEDVKELAAKGDLIPELIQKELSETRDKNFGKEDEGLLRKGLRKAFE